MPRPEAFKALKALGPERVAEVDLMLGKGEPAANVAHVIQDDWGALTDQSFGALKKMLERYRKSELRQKVIAQVAEATTGTRIGTLKKRLSVLEELETLVLIQKGRFDKLLVREQAGPLLLKQVSDEGRLLRDLLVDLGRMQLETGVLRRAPRTVHGMVTDPEGNVHVFSWSEEQEKLYRELENVTYEALG